jgi:hypothetical protein
MKMFFGFATGGVFEIGFCFLQKLPSCVKGKNSLQEKKEKWLKEEEKERGNKRERKRERTVAYMGNVREGGITKK